MDRLIYLYAGKGYNNNAVADFIGVNVNTYRSRVSRVSTKLSGLLFDGQRLIDACVYAPAEEIAKTRAYIDQLNNRLVIGKELSNYMLEKFTILLWILFRNSQSQRKISFRLLCL